MKEEIWKDINGYDGLYQVSNMGRVKSIGYGKTRFLNGKKDKDGYIQVCLFLKGVRKWFYVHRLVLNAFTDNTDCVNKECNHINEKKDDNRLCNLEWVTHIENMRSGTLRERLFMPKLKPIQQFTKRGILVREWGSITETKNYGFLPNHVSECCRGVRKSYKGFIWRYKNN